MKVEEEEEEHDRREGASKSAWIYSLTEGPQGHYDIDVEEGIGQKYLVRVSRKVWAVFEMVVD